MSFLGLAGAALLLDTLLGDPSGPLHPTRLMGRLALFLEGILHKEGHGKGLAILLGSLGWLGLVGSAAACAALFLALSTSLGGALAGLWGGAAPTGRGLGRAAASVVLVYISIAPRDLAAHAAAVAKALRGPGLEEGRKAVSRIVGRDVERLDEAGVVRACVESVAESAVDGVAAPLFWAFLLGPIGAVAYRAANTLDSMWGRKDGGYLYFGRAAARLDDAANWLPARTAFPLACLAALLSGLDASSALVLGWRDRRAHESPNAAWLEAAFAGALGIRLGGPSWYGGVLVDKPGLGEDGRPPRVEDIGKAILLMYVTVILYTAAGGLVASGVAGLAGIAGLVPR